MIRFSNEAGTRVNVPDRGDVSLEMFIESGGDLESVAPFQPFGGDVAAAVAAVIARLDAHAAALLRAAAGTDDPAQLKVYERKYARAQAVPLDELFVAEADGRGLTPAALAALVIQLYEAAEARGDAIETAKGIHKGAVAALALAGDLMGLARYDVTTGWPSAPGAV